MKIIKFVRPEIMNMKEINWGDLPDDTGMRLLWGENPIEPRSVFSVLKKEIKKINLYPSPTKNLLKNLLAKYNDVLPENIIPTNGSDEALELIAKVFISDEDEVIMAVPSYPCFASVSQMMGAKVVSIPLEKDFSLDIQKIISAIINKTKIVWIANPNNPTGNVLIQQDKLEEFIKQIPCIVVFDECYFEFANVSAAKLVEKYPNVIVTRSFTKALGLAGVRLGYIIASKKLAKFIDKLVQTNLVFNTNRFALAAGESILRNKKEIQKLIISFQKLKDQFEKKLASIQCVEVISTKTSFCLIDLKESNITAKDLKKALNKKGIFIKDCSIYEGFGSYFAYLGIPAKEYQKKVVLEIEKILEGGK